MAYIDPHDENGLITDREILALVICALISLIMVFNAKINHLNKYRVKVKMQKKVYEENN